METVRKPRTEDEIKRAKSKAIRNLLYKRTRKHGRKLKNSLKIRAVNRKIMAEHGLL